MPNTQPVFSGGSLTKVVHWIGWTDVTCLTVTVRDIRNYSFGIIPWRNKTQNALKYQEFKMFKGCQVSTFKALHEIEPLLVSSFISSHPFSCLYDGAMKDFFHFSKCTQLYPGPCPYALTMMMDNEDNEDAANLYWALRAGTPLRRNGYESIGMDSVDFFFLNSMFYFHLKRNNPFKTLL